MPGEPENAGPTTGPRRLHLAVLGQGTRGDLYPLLGIAREVSRRGPRVSVLEFDEYRADITAAGLSFVCVGSGSQCASVFAQVPTGPITARTEWLIGSLFFEASLRSAERFVAAARELSPRPDAILAPANHVGAILAAELLQVPLVSVFLGPTVLRQVSRPSAADPGRGTVRTAPPREAVLIDRFVLPRIGRIRRAVGLGPAPAGASFGAEPDRGGLLLSPGVLLRDEPPAPPGLDLAGYPDYFGIPAPPDPRIEAFLHAPGPPVVLVSLGDGWTQALPGPLRALAAQADAGSYRLVVLGGGCPACRRDPGPSWPRRPGCAGCSPGSTSRCTTAAWAPS